MWHVITDGPMKILKVRTSTSTTEGAPKMKEKLRYEWTVEHKRKTNLDNLAKYILYKTLDKNMFSKIKSCSTAKEIWENLTQLCEGNDQTKENKLMVATQKFDNIKMRPGETMTEFDERFNSIVIELSSLGKIYNNGEVVIETMRALFREWDIKTMTMRESKDLNKIELYDLFTDLKVYEFEINSRNKEGTSTSITFQALVTAEEPPVAIVAKSTKQINDDTMLRFVKSFCHFKADYKKPKRDDKKSFDKNNMKEQKALIVEESKRKLAESDSDKSSSSESEDEIVKCFMVDDNEVFDFNSDEFTKDDLTNAVNDIEYKKLCIKNIVGMFNHRDEEDEQKFVKGKVVLMKKNVLDFSDFNASIIDKTNELFGRKVSIQLVSSIYGDPSEKGLRGRLSKETYLDNWISSSTSIAAGDSVFDVVFEWEVKNMGCPGAFIIRNNHSNEFYLKSLTLDHVPAHGKVHFVCNSWVYPKEKYATDRVFFTNQTYLPNETPVALVSLREEELKNLRGDGMDNTKKLEEWDRVYDYAYYNDLGDPDRGENYARPVLGGSSEYPYPQRGRTSRPLTKTDTNIESRLPLISSLNNYVPRDERFGHLKMSDFLVYQLKASVQLLLPEFEALCDKTTNEFDTIQDTFELYEGGFKLPEGHLLEEIYKHIPLEMLKELLIMTDGEGTFKFPTPQVIQEDKSSWRTDEEFAREMLAGVNPVIISLLEEFPPKSKLDPLEYGNQNSTITKEHMEFNLDGLTIEETINQNKIFILDHHDSLMPYLSRINTTTTKTYASRTLLILRKDGTLMPLTIELSLPNPKGDKYGAISKVYTPAQHGVDNSIWQLAKAYVVVNDSGVHQLISHWLNTHAVIEPFVIATNRQLSVLHPIQKLLDPHFRDTMNINAFARQTLINAGGDLELTFFPSKYAMEMSSVVYRSWVFTDHSLPSDLIKRGIAVKDAKGKHGLRLLIEDYPYAVDGLEIWSAIKTWVEDYCNFYYKTDETVKNDKELQAWWKELKEVGHGDKKNELWWPKMETKKDLTETCTIIIWVASALHAALNFGQYPYAGYFPNRPTLSRRLMPEVGSPEYEELKTNPDKILLQTITAKLQAILVMSIIETLSRHSSDEVYLGQRDTPEWTNDVEPLEAFEKFGKKLAEIEEIIVMMNNDKSLKNRVGAVQVPYTLLFPTGQSGLSGKGIPNSVSI
ncbi:probable linoleate 9S-lipoxygenase 5 [Impatiens glandulifera]|uniref:probable linoleate 9S-lipoxygenase 5 n=1 Tax=Impatiens glandulifera TaxID=253017 RepID=UPI001FB18FC3|nr:probable linoleate 9S-lipoxygenase 5 [Impatiens glandulifera]